MWTRVQGCCTYLRSGFLALPCVMYVCTYVCVCRKVSASPGSTRWNSLLHEKGVVICQHLRLSRLTSTSKTWNFCARRSLLSSSLCTTCVPCRGHRAVEEPCPSCPLPQALSRGGGVQAPPVTSSATAIDNSGSSRFSSQAARSLGLLSARKTGSCVIPLASFRSGQHSAEFTFFLRTWCVSSCSHVMSRVCDP